MLPVSISARPAFIAPPHLQGGQLAEDSLSTLTRLRVVREIPESLAALVEAIRATFPEEMVLVDVRRTMNEIRDAVSPEEWLSFHSALNLLERQNSSQEGMDALHRLALKDPLLFHLRDRLLKNGSATPSSSSFLLSPLFGARVCPRETIVQVLREDRTLILGNLRLVSFQQTRSRPLRWVATSRLMNMIAASNPAPTSQSVFLSSPEDGICGLAIVEWVEDRNRKEMSLDTFMELQRLQGLLESEGGNTPWSTLESIFQGNESFREALAIAKELGETPAQFLEAAASLRALDPASTAELVLATLLAQPGRLGPATYQVSLRQEGSRWVAELHLDSELDDHFVSTSLKRNQLHSLYRISYLYCIAEVRELAIPESVRQRFLTTPALHLLFQWIKSWIAQDLQIGDLSRLLAENTSLHTTGPGQLRVDWPLSLPAGLLRNMLARMESIQRVLMNGNATLGDLIRELEPILFYGIEALSVKGESAEALYKKLTPLEGLDLGRILPLDQEVVMEGRKTTIGEWLQRQEVFRSEDLSTQLRQLASHLNFGGLRGGQAGRSLDPVRERELASLTALVRLYQHSPLSGPRLDGRSLPLDFIQKLFNDSTHDFYNPALTALCILWGAEPTSMVPSYRNALVKILSQLHSADHREVNGIPGLIRFLLGAGANPNGEDIYADGMTPLHHLATQFDPSTRFPSQDHSARFLRAERVLEILLEMGADIDRLSRGWEGGRETPLDRATRKEKVQACIALIRHGASVSNLPHKLAELLGDASEATVLAARSPCFAMARAQRHFFRKEGAAFSVQQGFAPLLEGQSILFDGIAWRLTPLTEDNLCFLAAERLVRRLIGHVALPMEPMRVQVREQVQSYLFTQQMEAVRAPNVLWAPENFAHLALLLLLMPEMANESDIFYGNGPSHPLAFRGGRQVFSHEAPAGPLSVLFCHNQVRSPIPVAVRNAWTQFDLEQFFADWLGGLAHLERDGVTPSFSLSEAGVDRLYFRLKQIKRRLSQPGPAPTPLDILLPLYPQATTLYRFAVGREMSPEKRYEEVSRGIRQIPPPKRREGESFIPAQAIAGRLSERVIREEEKGAFITLVRRLLPGKDSSVVGRARYKGLVKKYRRGIEQQWNDWNVLQHAWLLDQVRGEDRKALLFVLCKLGLRSSWIELDLSDMGLNLNEIRKILGVQPMVNALNISGCDLSDEDVKNLVSGCVYLTRLTLHSGNRLKTLNIESVMLTHLDIQDLAVESLRINAPLIHLDCEGCRQLRLIQNVDRSLVSLTHLNLKGCRSMDTARFRGLLRELSRLEELELDGSLQIQDAEMYVRHHALLRFNLEDPSRTALRAGVEQLLNVSRPCLIDLTGVPLSLGDVEALSIGLRAGQCQSLVLRNCGLTNETMGHLLEGIRHSPFLSHLDLSHNAFSADQLPLLASALSACPIRSLALRELRVDSTAMRDFLLALSPQSIRELDFSDLEWTDREHESIPEVFSRFERLERLNLRGWGLSELAWGALATLPTLYSLDLGPILPAWESHVLTLLNTNQAILELAGCKAYSPLSVALEKNFQARPAARHASGVVGWFSRTSTSPTKAERDRWMARVAEQIQRIGEGSQLDVMQRIELEHARGVLRQVGQSSESQLAETIHQLRMAAECLIWCKIGQPPFETPPAPPIPAPASASLENVVDLAALQRDAWETMDGKSLSESIAGWIRLGQLGPFAERIEFALSLGDGGWELDDQGLIRLTLIPSKLTTPDGLSLVYAEGENEKIKAVIEGAIAHHRLIQAAVKAMPKPQEILVAEIQPAPRETIAGEIYWAVDNNVIAVSRQNPWTVSLRQEGDRWVYDSLGPILLFVDPTRLGSPEGITLAPESEENPEGIQQKLLDSILGQMAIRDLLSKGKERI